MGIPADPKCGFGCHYERVETRYGPAWVFRASKNCPQHRGASEMVRDRDKKK